MNRPYNNNRAILINGVFVLIIFLSACTNDGLHISPEVKTITITSTLISPATPTKTTTPSPTETKMTFTKTTIPTLPADIADARVVELLKTNSGCSLPCWWSIKPGITTADQTQSILEPFLSIVTSDVRYEFSETGGHLLMRPDPQSGLRVGIQYLVEENTVSMIYVNTAKVRDNDHKIYDDSFYQEAMSPYSLKTILTRYGKPEQIFIRSFSDLAADNNPTQILLYYPNEGIVAEFFSQNELVQKNETIFNRICPPKSLISLRLFKPNSGLSLSYLLSVDDNFSKYKNVSEATNMDVDTFFQTYQNYDESSIDLKCPAFLTTPWDLWPNIYSNV